MSSRRGVIDLPAICRGDGAREAISDFGFRILRSAVEMSSAVHSSKPLDPGPSTSTQPYLAEWDNFVASNEDAVRLLHQRLQARVVDHFLATRKHRWSEETFREPFVACARESLSSEAMRRYDDFIGNGWTEPERGRLVLSVHVESVARTKAFQAYVNSISPERQCEHVWMIRDILAVLVKVGETETNHLESASTGPLRPRSAFTYGSLVLDALVDDRVSYEYAYKLEHLLLQVLDDPGHPSHAGDSPAVTG